MTRSCSQFLIFCREAENNITNRSNSYFSAIWEIPHVVAAWVEIAMYALFALVSTVLTSFLPILSKYLLRDTHPALVAWAINAASLPLLAGGTLLITQCRITPLQGDILLSCTTHLPRIDGVFFVALLASALLNWAATLFSTSALAQEDASLVSPLLTFNPAFTLLIAWLLLREIPGLVPTVGVVLLLFGAYLLEVEEARTGLLLACY